MCRTPLILAIILLVDGALSSNTTSSDEVLAESPVVATGTWTIRQGFLQEVQHLITSLHKLESRRHARQLVFPPTSDPQVNTMTASSADRL